MRRSVFGFDWRKSNAHLLLLSKFLRPKTEADFSKSDDWKSVLAESPKQTIKRFLDEGTVVQADLGARLDYRFKAVELKEMLKKRGLPVSGRKGDLIQRLVEVDPEGMRDLVEGLIVLQCSEGGREIAEDYLKTEKAKRNQVEQQIVEHLRQRSFRDASNAVASYEAEQIFQRGIGMDWKNHNPARDIAMLRTIFDRKPKILGQLSDDQLDSLRLAAGMMYLWGTNQGRQWLPASFETDLAMDNDATARMFSFYASHQVNLDSYLQSGVVKQVEILAAPNSCDACKKLSGKRFRLDQTPELPYEHCTHEMGCRCTILPITD